MQKVTGALVVLSALMTAPSAMSGTLFIGADVEDFQGGCSVALCGFAGGDRLGVADVTGSTFNSSSVIQTNFLLNGMADAGGVLLMGTPSANALNTVDFNGNLISTIAAPGIPNSGCCNEELLFVPQAVGAAKVYHAHFSDRIREINPTTGAQLAVFLQNDVVGMALVNGQIWISKWGGRSIGIWDPSANSYTVMIANAALRALGNTGALAFDPTGQILWVGSQGGRVTPFSLAGTQLGASFLPFGAMNQTIDGLTFLGEVTQIDVAEPGTLALLAIGLLGLGLSRRRQRAA